MTDEEYVELCSDINDKLFHSGWTIISASGNIKVNMDFIIDNFTPYEARCMREKKLYLQLWDGSVEIKLSKIRGVIQKEEDNT
jgi:hypothetical protein